MNEVAQAVAGTDATLALIPRGSGNGLARTLGIPMNPAKAISLLRNGVTRTIDMGMVNDLPFFCAMGCGFDAQVVERFNTMDSRGLAGYAITVARELRHCRSRRFVVTCGEQRLEVLSPMVSVCNAGQFGNNAWIAPQAKLDDGRVDLTALPPLNPFNILPLAVRLFARTLDKAGGVISLPGSRLTIEREAPGLIHTDGESHTAGATLEITVRQGALKVLTV